MLDQPTTSGLRLQQARKDRRLTRARLSKLTEVPYENLRAWEEGQTEPSVRDLRPLESYLGVTAEWLVLGDQLSAKTKAQPGSRSIPESRSQRLQEWLERREAVLTPDVLTKLSAFGTSGEKIRFLRDISGLYQNEVLSTVGLPTGKLTRLEGNHEEPTEDHLRRLAKFFGVPPELLR